MGRLTSRKENGEAYVQLYADPAYPARVVREQLEKEKKVIEKLAHYEDIEEQGRLIELPCKVGEKIYRPINNHIIEFIVIGLIYDIIKDRWSYETVYQSGTDWRKGVCDFGLIGEIVFLTKEEAEAKLKEMRGAE